jgi:hypothetical protein
MWMFWGLRNITLVKFAQTWKGNLPPFLMNLWLDRCEPGNTIDWNEGDEECKLSPYSLPLPKYINKI